MHVKPKQVPLQQPNVLPQSVSNSQDGKSSNDGKDKKLLSETSLSSLSAKTLSKDGIRDAIVAELFNIPVEYNRFYTGTLSGYTQVSINTTFSSFIPLSDVAIGQGANDRLGNTVRARRLRLSLHVRPSITGPTVDNNGVIASEEYSLAYRVVVVVDKMPVIGLPIYGDTNSWDIGSTVYPFSTQSTHTFPTCDLSGGVVNQGGINLLADRNPVTLRRYHILHDATYNPSSRYNSLDTDPNDTTRAYPTASVYHHFDFDLYGMVLQWYDETSPTAVFSNRISFTVIADAPIAIPTSYKYNSCLEFENVA